MSTSREIAVLANHRHPRLRYVLTQLSEWWGVKLRLFTSTDRYLAHEAPLGRINYGAAATGKNEVRLFAHRFLAGGAVSPGDLDCLPEPTKPDVTAKSLPPTTRFFLNPDNSATGLRGYDSLAMLFFCLSRYEEYGATDQLDDHGRFPGRASHAFRNAYLRRPLINFHLEKLAGQLHALFPACKPSLPAPELRLTYDVDVPYAYRLRGWRGIASGLRDLIGGNYRRALHRFKCLLSKSDPDPFDVFVYLRQLHLANGIKPRFFWLLAAVRSKFDPNPDPAQPELQQLIRATAADADIGIHPSYYSSEQPTLFEAEKNHLRQIVQRPVIHSRQHFLRFQLPATYRQLLLAGLEADHSMGYADLVGYRAGTNLSFRWYDLEREKMTRLRVHPFAAMDVSLLKYEKLSYFESQKLLLQMAEAVRSTGGPFTLLWHNSSFAEDFGWGGWGEMYEVLVAQLADLLRDENA